MKIGPIVRGDRLAAERDEQRRRAQKLEAALKLALSALHDLWQALPEAAQASGSPTAEAFEAAIGEIDDVLAEDQSDNGGSDA